jgi:hypothetical protein
MHPHVCGKVGLGRSQEKQKWVLPKTSPNAFKKIKRWQQWVPLRVAPKPPNVLPGLM